LLFISLPPGTSKEKSRSNAMQTGANFYAPASQKYPTVDSDPWKFPDLCAASGLPLSEFGIVRETKMGSKAMINSDTTVREVALNIPESTRLFEKLKIDYCCGGNKPLAEACASAGVDFDNVMELLAGVKQSDAKFEGAEAFQNLSATELITHILDTHHVFTKSEMDRLQPLVDKVFAAHGGSHPELVHVAELFMRLCADLRPHMFKEEQILFPYIVATAEAADQNRTAPFAPFGTVNNPIRMMMREHDTAGQILRELRAVTSDYKIPDGVCLSYQTLYQALENFEKDLHQHIHLENNILFPKAVELEKR
jgi:regulator of cell morphogenesis and NO signaling